MTAQELASAWTEARDNFLALDEKFQEKLQEIADDVSAILLGKVEPGEVCAKYVNYIRASVLDISNVRFKLDGHWIYFYLYARGYSLSAYRAFFSSPEDLFCSDSTHTSRVAHVISLLCADVFCSLGAPMVDSDTCAVQGEKLRVLNTLPGEELSDEAMQDYLACPWWIVDGKPEVILVDKDVFDDLLPDDYGIDWNIDTKLIRVPQEQRAWSSAQGWHVKSP